MLTPFRFAFHQLLLAGGLLTLSALTVHANKGLRITPISPTEVWHRAEFLIENVPVTSNNFDPDLIRIDASITSPSGQITLVPAFWFQDFTRAQVSGAEVLTAKGAEQWRLRFTPTEAGEYTLSLTAQLEAPSNAIAPIVTHFRVTGSTVLPLQHWVQKSPDARAFQTSDGKMLRLIGENVCWGEGRGTYDFDHWFGALHDSGQNFARVWLCPWSLAIEHKPNTLNNYSLKDAWQLDHVFDQAEQGGIYLLLCLDHHGMYQTENSNWDAGNNYWKSNPYSLAQGGPCPTPNDFFTNAQAKNIYQKRLRYLIARYGYSPALLAWEFFNEIDNVYQPQQALSGPDVAAWHQAMGQWLHANDPFHHLVSTSLTGGSDRPEIWSLPEMDFTMYHSYGDPAPAKVVADLSRDFLQRYRKPVLIGEFGVSAAEWALSADPHLRGFRQLLWGGALGGSVGTSMSWWWESIDREHVYPLYRTLADIMTGAGWKDDAWTPIVFGGEPDAPRDVGPALPDKGVFNARVALSSFRRAPISDEVAIANPLAAERASEQLSSYLLGTKNGGPPHPIKLHAIFGPAAKLTFRVNSVASDVELVVSIDGVEGLRTRIFDRDGSQAGNHEIDRDFSVPIPAGKHVIQILNTGSDWANLGSLNLHSVAYAEFANGWKFSPQTIALRSQTRNRAVLYLYSPYIVYPAGAYRYQPPLEENETIILPHWPEGKFSVQWLNPETGAEVTKTEATTAHGSLSIEIPAFREDLTAIVSPSS